MKRLIDSDALMKAMYHRAFETDGDTMWQSGCWVRYRAIEQVVKEQPTVETIKKEDLLGWLLAYHTTSFELKGRYMPHEVISWLINDLSKNFLNEGETP